MPDVCRMQKSLVSDAAGSALAERLRALEREKAALMAENVDQRRRYERCLADVTGHVVRVLLAQKVSKPSCLVSVT